jgi:hypothetical protein
MLDDGASDAKYYYQPYIVIIILVDLSLLPDNLSFFCGLMAQLVVSPRTTAEMEVAMEVSWATK